VSTFPVPYTIAMHIAFRILAENIEKPSHDSLQTFVGQLIEQMPQGKVESFTAQLSLLKSDIPQIEKAMTKIQQILTVELFDMFLSTLPGHIRLQYAIRYGRPLPSFNVEISRLELTFEFVQAVADIEGAEAALALIQE
jgi:hypothetical protein